MVREKLVLVRWVALFWMASALMLLLDANAALRQEPVLLIACLVLTGVFAILGVAFAVSAARRSPR